MSTTSRATERAPVTKRRLGIACAYAVQGLLFLSLTTRIPRITQLWGIGEGTMSAFMLLMVLLAGAGSFVAERLATTRGSALALRVGFVLLALGMAIIGQHLSLAVFVVGLGIYGFAVGIVDAASNMQAVALEHEMRRPILPSFHGAWTLGGIVGTVITLLTAHVSLGLGALLLAICPLLLLPAPLMHAGGVIEPADEKMGIQWRHVMLVGIGLVLFYMVDTASTTWGTTYLEKVVHSPAGLAPLATLPYLVTTLATRFAGDRLTDRLGPVRLLRIGAVIAFVALAVIVLAQNWAMAVAGFAVLGVGIAVVAPLSFSAAAAIAREGGAADPAAMRARVDAVIARFNQFNYVGALLGSVMTGALGAIDLRIGFVVPLVLILGLLPLARAFAPR